MRRNKVEEDTEKLLYISQLKQMGKISEYFEKLLGNDGERERSHDVVVLAIEYMLILQGELAVQMKRNIFHISGSVVEKKAIALAAGIETISLKVLLDNIKNIRHILADFYHKIDENNKNIIDINNLQLRSHILLLKNFIVEDNKQLHVLNKNARAAQLGWISSWKETLNAIKNKTFANASRFNFLKTCIGSISIITKVDQQLKHSENYYAVNMNFVKICTCLRDLIDSKEPNLKSAWKTLDEGEKNALQTIRDLREDFCHSMEPHDLEITEAKKNLLLNTLNTESYLFFFEPALNQFEENFQISKSQENEKAKISGQNIKSGAIRSSFSDRNTATMFKPGSVPENKTTKTPFSRTSQNQKEEKPSNNTTTTTRKKQ